jgi:apolipoprotein N-acyltransferase
LKNLLGQIFLRSRYPLAAGAGFVLAAAFPSLGIAGFAWVAPALLLTAAYGKTGGDAFRIGYVGGLTHFLLSLSWLLNIPAKGFPILGWLALSAYLAIYPGTWVWLLSGKIGQGSWLRRLTWTLLGAAVWVALEMTQARLLSGFPWNVLGASQFKQLPLIQIASVTGVYGVSFVVVWTSLTILSATLAILRRPTTRYIWLGDMLLPMLVVLGLYMFGTSRLRALRDDGHPTLCVTFVQPSIPQTMIWDPAANDRRFAELLRLTTDALTNTTELLIWPEAAVPKMIRYDEETLHTITRLAQSNRVWMIVGSDDAEPARSGTKSDRADYFNASFLISPDGGLAARYCKRNLVIFGEYVPLVRWVPFVKWLTPIDGGFEAGDRVVPFVLERRSPSRTATLICFEDVFPHLVPEYVSAGTDFLVNLTNDGWFGEGGEQWQHTASAIFRAVENGVPLLRCCNNGVTCWIDSRGVVRQVFRDTSGTVHGAGVMTAQIPLLASGEKREPTFYNRHGDWFGWGCVIVTSVVLVPRLPKTFRRKRAEQAKVLPDSV